jgi:DNA-binding transcriptional LysR family regulator
MPLPAHVRDLLSFELLLSVRELGSIGRAARRHGMSQPAASARLKLLENQVGVALLERRARGARLTAAGQLAAGWAQPAVEAASDLAEGLAALRQDRDAQMRVSASLTVAEYLLPRWLVALRAMDPATLPTLRTGNSELVAEQVLAGVADLGFVEGPTAPEGLRTQVVAEDELVVVVAPGHPWARRSRPVGAAALWRTPLVAREPGSGTRQAFETAVSGCVDEPRAAPALEVSSTTAIKAAVVGGIGPAVLSSYAVAAELASGELVRVRVSGVELGRQLRAVWPAGQRLRGPAGDLLGIALRGGQGSAMSRTTVESGQPTQAST